MQGPLKKEMNVLKECPPEKGFSHEDVNHRYNVESVHSALYDKHHLSRGGALAADSNKRVKGNLFVILCHKETWM